MNFARIWSAHLLLGLSLLNRAEADTQVCGTIVGGHWTLAGSPYRVTCNTYVISLTIDPGVSVLVQSNCVFEVDGVLTAIGTAAQPINFRQAGAGGWRGIAFNYSLPGSMLAYCAISNSSSSGISIVGNGVPFMQNCIIGNNARGVRASGVSGVHLVMESCTIAGNSNSSGAAGIYAELADGDLVLRDCMLVRNSSGGIFASTSPANRIRLEGCTIAGNSAPNGYGGGIYAASGSLQMQNCLVTTNTAKTGSDRPSAGVYCVGSFLACSNCVFSGNVAGTSGLGGAIWTYTPGIMSNCNFAHNGPGSIWVGPLVTLTIVNSIFWSMTGAATHISGTTNVTYSNVEAGFAGSFPGVGNTSVNPLFTDQTTLTLLPSSPCNDAGDPDPSANDVCFPPSQGGIRNDMGAYGGPGACNWPAVRRPGIVSQPQSQASCLGQGASFHATATGALPLAYQWWFGGAPIASETKSTLSLTGLQADQAGPYSVVVTNAFGSVTSAPAQLVINDACVDLHMYAGLSISGLAGQAYVLSYSTNLINTNGWIPLATNVMPASGWFYLDMVSPFSPYRFYKAKLTN